MKHICCLIMIGCVCAALAQNVPPSAAPNQGSPASLNEAQPQPIAPSAPDSSAAQAAKAPDTASAVNAQPVPAATTPESGGSSTVSKTKYSIIAMSGWTSQSYYTWNYISQTGDETTRSSLALIAGLGIQPGKLVEYRPAVGYIHRSEYYVPSNSSGEQTSLEESTSNNGLFFGFGLYFHFVNNEYFDAMIGPALSVNYFFTPSEKSGTSVAREYARYNDLYVSISIPLNVDLKLTHWLSIRAAMEVIGYGAYLNYQKEKGGSFDRSTLTTAFSLETQWTPSLGCVFQF